MIVRKLPKDPFPDIPAGHSRRGAITHQTLTIKHPKTKPERKLTYALTKPRHVEGYVTRTELAAERGIQAQLARLYLQRAGIKKPAEGWRWKEGSKALWKARVALGLKP